MGKIKVEIHLENFIDRYSFIKKEIQELGIRKYSMQATVDTEAVMLSIPQDVVEKLKLEILRTVIVTYADERKEERPVALPFT